MDTQNSHIWKEIHKKKKTSLLISMLDFGGVIHLVSSTKINRVKKMGNLKPSWHSERCVDRWFAHHTVDGPRNSAFPAVNNRIFTWINKLNMWRWKKTLLMDKHPDKHVYVEKYCYQTSPGEGDFFISRRNATQVVWVPTHSLLASVPWWVSWSTVGSSCDVAIFFFKGSHGWRWNAVGRMKMKWSW